MVTWVLVLSGQVRMPFQGPLGGQEAMAARARGESSSLEITQEVYSAADRKRVFEFLIWQYILANLGKAIWEDHMGR